MVCAVDVVLINGRDEVSETISLFVVVEATVESIEFLTLYKVVAIGLDKLDDSFNKSNTIINQKRKTTQMLLCCSCLSTTEANKHYYFAAYAYKKAKNGNLTASASGKLVNLIFCLV